MSNVNSMVFAGLTNRYSEDLSELSTAVVRKTSFALCCGKVMLNINKDQCPGCKKFLKWQSEHWQIANMRCERYIERNRRIPIRIKLTEQERQETLFFKKVGETMTFQKDAKDVMQLLYKRGAPIDNTLEVKKGWSVHRETHEDYSMTFVFTDIESGYFDER